MKLSSPATALVVQRIRDRIVSGDIPPGAPLRQEDLAARMGVSRIPIRDALARLEAEGLVEIRSDRGAYVAGLDRDRCVEVFDLRVLIECDTLGHAIPRHHARSLRAARAIQAELEVEDETMRWLEGDRRFHEALYEPSGRELSLQMVRTLRNAVERFCVARLSHATRRDEWRDEHRDLLEAVAARDSEQARTCLTRHLRATQEVVLSALDEDRSGK